MSLFGSMSASVSALRAHTQKMGTISDNVANVETTGYKAFQTPFISMVTATDPHRGTHAPGGSYAKTMQNLEQQGIIKSTQSETDLAINGKGFFLVRTAPENVSGSQLGCTRAGSFHMDHYGHLVNDAGFYLQGWRYNDDGTTVQGLGDLDQVKSIDVSHTALPAKATTALDLSLRLPANAEQNASYTNTMQVYDSLGQDHTVTMTWTKTATDREWTLAISSPDATGNIADEHNNRPYLLTVTFNEDGAPVYDRTRGNAGEEAASMHIVWSNGAASSDVQLNIGTAGTRNGIVLEGEEFHLLSFDQNGEGVRDFYGISITEEGIVNATFDNGNVQRLYKIPLATCASPDHMTVKNGSIYFPNEWSGGLVARAPREDGLGVIVPTAVEASTTDIAQELSDMIITQHGYSANTKVVATVDEMLEYLERI